VLLDEAARAERVLLAVESREHRVVAA
jgi:hypothetical protein